MTAARTAGEFGSTALADDVGEFDHLHGIIADNLGDELEAIGGDGKADSPSDVGPGGPLPSPLLDRPTRLGTR